MELRGWERPDFVYVSGDAYVDHPSFGHAIITRMLESLGYKVCCWPSRITGRRRASWSSGNPVLRSLCRPETWIPWSITIQSPGRGGDGRLLPRRRHGPQTGLCGGGVLQPDPPGLPAYAGHHRGIEASLRRLAHYDYWSDSLKRSILMDSGADLISYGMGERSIAAIAEALDAGIAVRDLTYIDGTVCKVRDLSSVYDPVILPSYDELRQDRLNYARSFYTQYCNTDPLRGAQARGALFRPLLYRAESAVQALKPDGDG